MRNNTTVKKILRQWFFLIPGALVFIAFIFCELNKAYWDYRVDQWCEKEGGVTVNKVYAVSRSEHPEIFLSGSVFIPSSQAVLDDGLLYRTFDIEYLKKAFQMYLDIRKKL